MAVKFISIRILLLIVLALVVDYTNPLMIKTKRGSKNTSNKGEPKKSKKSTPRSLSMANPTNSFLTESRKLQGIYDQCSLSIFIVCTILMLIFDMPWWAVVLVSMGLFINLLQPSSEKKRKLAMSNQLGSRMMYEIDFKRVQNLLKTKKAKNLFYTEKQNLVKFLHNNNINTENKLTHRKLTDLACNYFEQVHHKSSKAFRYRVKMIADYIFSNKKNIMDMINQRIK